MAVPRKGWRKITVHNQDYYWRAIGRDHPGGDWPGGIDVVVVTETAFQRGQKAQQLKLSLRYDHLETPYTTPYGNGISLHQQAAVTPRVVARAIEWAIAQEPPFTGESGLDDVEVSGGIVEELQALAHTAP